MPSWELWGALAELSVLEPDLQGRMDLGLLLVAEAAGPLWMVLPTLHDVPKALGAMLSPILVSPVSLVPLPWRSNHFTWLWVSSTCR